MPPQLPGAPTTSQGIAALVLYTNHTPITPAAGPPPPDEKDYRKWRNTTLLPMTYEAAGKVKFAVGVVGLVLINSVITFLAPYFQSLADLVPVLEVLVEWSPAAIAAVVSAFEHVNKVRAAVISGSIEHGKTRGDLWNEVWQICKGGYSPKQQAG